GCFQRPKAMRMQDDETGSGAGPGAEGGPEGVGGERPDVVGFGPPEAGPDAPGTLDASGQPGTPDGEPYAPEGEPGPPEGEPGVAAGEPRRRRRRRMAVYAVVVLAAAGLGSAAAVGLTSNAGTPPTGVSSHQVPGPQNNVAGGGSLRASAVAAKVDPGVVDVDASIAYSGGTSSEGTGMVIS